MYHTKLYVITSISSYFQTNRSCICVALNLLKLCQTMNICKLQYILFSYIDELTVFNTLIRWTDNSSYAKLSMTDEQITAVKIKQQRLVSHLSSYRIPSDRRRRLGAYAPASGRHGNTCTINAVCVNSVNKQTKYMI